MKSMLMKAGLIAGLAGSLLLATATSGYATSAGVDAAVMVGSGGISPGLALTPAGSAAQTFGFNTIAAVGGGVGVSDAPAVGEAVGTVACAFSGSGFGWAGMSSGTASGSCTSPGNPPVSVGSGSTTCTGLTVTQVGPIVVVDGINTCVAAAGGVTVGPSTTATAGVFLFIPTSTPGSPVTSYDLVGAAAGGGVS